VTVQRSIMRSTYYSFSHLARLSITCIRIWSAPADIPKSWTSGRPFFVRDYHWHQHERRHRHGWCHACQARV